MNNEVARRWRPHRPPLGTRNGSIERATELALTEAPFGQELSERVAPDTDALLGEEPAQRRRQPAQLRPGNPADRDWAQEALGLLETRACEAEGRGIEPACSYNALGNDGSWEEKA